MPKPDSPRLGRGFGALWAANAVSNVGDGVTLAAGPLLVASLTDDPALIAGAAFAQQLPWLLFSLISGAYVDRLDRRRLIVLANLLRAVVLAVLALSIAAGDATVLLVYTSFFLLGSAETVADNAALTLVPALVPAEALPTANARLIGSTIFGNQMLGPPLGAWLFVAAAALPFEVDAASFLVAAGLLLLLPRHAARAPEAVAERDLRAEIAEGVRWLWRHRVLRMFALSLGLLNATFLGAMSILVLYARDRLGLSEFGYGLLLSCSAVGGLAGSVFGGRLERRFGASTLMRVGLLVETGTHLAFALTRTPWVAVVTYTAFGVHAVIWGMVTASYRQRVVPDRLRGRVNSVYYLFGVGGAALGALQGGLVARAFGITAPFWLAFGVMVVFTASVWRMFSARSLEAEHRQVAAEDAVAPA